MAQSAHIEMIQLLSIQPHPRLVGLLGDVDSRAASDSAPIQELIEEIRAGNSIRPISVVPSPDGGYYLIEGRGRLFAHREAGCDEILAVVEVLEDGDAWARMILDATSLVERSRAQTAALAYELIKIYRKPAEARRLANLKRGNRSPEVRDDAPRENDKPRDTAGQALGLNGSTIQDLLKVYIDEYTYKRLVGEKTPEIKKKIAAIRRQCTNKKMSIAAARKQVGQVLRGEAPKESDTSPESRPPKTAATSSVAAAAEVSDESSASPPEVELEQAPIATAGRVSESLGEVMWKQEPGLRDDYLESIGILVHDAPELLWETVERDHVEAVLAAADSLAGASV